MHADGITWIAMMLCAVSGSALFPAKVRREIENLGRKRLDEELDDIPD